MWKLLACDIWRDGGSYSASLRSADRVVSLWLQVSTWDRLEDRTYEALFVSEGRDATAKQQHVPAGAEQRRWLAVLEHEVDRAGVDQYTAGTFAELVAELRALVEQHENDPF